MKVIITKRADGSFMVGNYELKDYKTGKVYDHEKIIIEKNFDVPTAYLGPWGIMWDGKSVLEEPEVKRWIKEFEVKKTYIWISNSNCNTGGEKLKQTNERNIEVFIARVAEDHSFWAGEPESLGWFSQEEIDRGEEEEFGGTGMYSYKY